MKTLALAVVLFAFIYADVGYMSKFGSDYENSETLGRMIIIVMMLFILTFFFEGNL